MPTEKFKIVFTSNAGGTVTEVVEFNCSEPLAAVKGYVDEIVNEGNSRRGWVAAKVYPVTPEAVLEIKGKCCGGKKCKTVKVESDLFSGYTVNKKSETFFTPESRWIESVSWIPERHLVVNFLHRAPITYQLGYDMFEAWKSWVESGGSAGQFFNANVKGNETF